MYFFTPIGNLRYCPNSGLFDSQYYIFEYPDVRKENIDPISHYITNNGSSMMINRETGVIPVRSRRCNEEYILFATVFIWEG